MNLHTYKVDRLIYLHKNYKLATNFIKIPSYLLLFIKFFVRLEFNVILFLQLISPSFFRNKTELLKIAVCNCFKIGSESRGGGLRTNEMYCPTRNDIGCS